MPLHQSGTKILRIETGRGNFLDHMASIATASPNIHLYSNDSSSCEKVSLAIWVAVADLLNRGSSSCAQALIWKIQVKFRIIKMGRLLFSQREWEKIL